jgi:predicted Holliday junction resolvase-like endonuclease
MNVIMLYVVSVISAAAMVVLAVINFMLRKKLLDRENITKGDLEARLDKSNRRVIDEVNAKNELEKQLAVESDKAIRWEQAYTNVQQKRDQDKENFERLLKEKIKESNNKQRSTIKGQVAEQFAPYLPGFKYNPKDARFLGMPVDYIIFDGLADGEVQQVVFMECKTGNSQLSSVQRNLRDVIKEKKVKWHVHRINVPEDNGIDDDADIIS